ncbi:MAG: dethiobiotin synthase [Gammaproteobacteria bacterium]|nr:dethiobiotin synthase [Gammaproteobacteria bacterium]
MTAPGVFVTGTDTEIGKTVVAQAIAKTWIERGHRVAGMKPVASGCRVTREGLRNDDALALQKACNVPAAYAAVNPYAFEPAIAPHIAAHRSGTRIDLGRIQCAFDDLVTYSDRVIVEGVGGWLVPLDERLTVADLALRLRLPVVLVVGIRLGCINHALLSYASISASGCPLAGWVANHCDLGCEAGAEIVASLRNRLPAPLCAELPWMEDPVNDAHLHIGELLAGGCEPLIYCR